MIKKYDVILVVLLLLFIEEIVGSRDNGIICLRLCDKLYLPINNENRFIDYHACILSCEWWDETDGWI